MKILRRLSYLFLICSTFACQREQEPTVNLALLTTYKWGFIQLAEYRQNTLREIYIDSTIYDFNTAGRYTAFATTAGYTEEANGNMVFKAELDEAYSDRYELNNDTRQLVLHYPDSTWHGAQPGTKHWQIIELSRERLVVVEEFPGTGIRAQFELEAIAR